MFFTLQSEEINSSISSVAKNTSFDLNFLPKEGDVLGFLLLLLLPSSSGLLVLGDKEDEFLYFFLSNGVLSFKRGVPEGEEELEWERSLAVEEGSKGGGGEVVLASLLLLFVE